MNFRTISMAAVAALALVAGRADAQDAQVVAQAPSTTDAGWNTKYGILFTIPNLFDGHVTSDTSVIGELDGGPMTADRLAGAPPPFTGRVGAQYNLDSTHGLRLSLALGRFSEGISETTNSLTGVTVKTVPDVTSALAAELGAQYMIRVTTSAVAPYVGAGVKAGYAQWAKKGKDQISGIPAFYQYDNSASAVDFGVIGTLGLEWRIHKVIALFAEYQADLTLVSTFKAEINERDEIGPLVAGKVKETHYASLSTGLGQLGQLGLIAFF